LTAAVIILTCLLRSSTAPSAPAGSSRSVLIRVLVVLVGVLAGIILVVHIVWRVLLAARIILLPVLRWRRWLLLLVGIILWLSGILLVKVCGCGCFPERIVGV